MAITTTLIQSLIDKRDANEVVRDKIAEILLAESASQQQLAIADGRDPAPWKLRVFIDRSNPWEEWRDLEADDPTADRSPIVNITLESMSFPGAKGDTVEKQSAAATFFIDCYGVGISAQTLDGHVSADQMAAAECQRCFRLVRNILMAATYIYLDLRGHVGKRWPQSVQFLQPELDTRPTQKVNVARFSLGVDFNEYSPQYEGQTLESIVVDVIRHGSGEVYFTAEYPYGSP